MVPEALMAGTASLSVLETITNVNYILDPSGVNFASPEGDVSQNNRITNSLSKKNRCIFTETDVSQCLLSHCLLWWLHLTFYQALFQ